MSINNKLSVSSNLAKSGKLECSILTLQNGGVLWDISNYISDMRIEYEFNKFAAGYIEFIDTDNMLHKNYSIMGGETVIVKIFKQSMVLPYGGYFRIMGIDLITSPELDVSPNKNVYRIDILSEAGYTNYTRLIRRGFSGTKKTEDVVASLFKDLQETYFTESADYKFDRLVQPSKTTFDNFIIPNWTALQTLEYLRKISISVDDDIFCFYENQFGLNWMSLTNLLNFKYPVVSIVERFTENPDTMRDIVLYGQSVLDHSFDTVRDLYKESLNDSVITNKVNLNTKTKATTKLSKNIHTDVLDKYKTIGNASFYNQTYINDTKNINYSEYREAASQFDTNLLYELRKNMFKNYMFNATIDFNSIISPGTIVMYDMVTQQDTNNSMLSGPWMVYRHAICCKFEVGEGADRNASGKYITSEITLCRDSFSYLDAAKASLSAYMKIEGESVVSAIKKMLDDKSSNNAGL